MLLRKCGTESPKKRAEGLARGGVIAVATSERRNGARLCLAIAALLLVCVLTVGTVGAETVEVNDWDELYDNITSGNSVKLTKNIDNANSSLKIETGNTITLDLNGKNLSDLTKTTSEKSNDDYNSIFTLTGGNLTINDSGTGGEIVSNFTTIRVLKGTLDVKKGLLIGYNAAPLDPKNNFGWTIYVKGSSSDLGESYSNVIIGDNAHVKGYTYAIGIAQNGTASYGVTIDVSGNLEGYAVDNAPYDTTGIYINGVVNKTLGNVPKITINDSANVTGEGGPGIYAAGYAEWIINGGTISGSEALSIKSGNWTIYGGIFTANGPFYDPAEYNGNGSEPTGAALSVTTNHDYAKNVSITITGGNFTSTDQSAFYEGSSWDKDKGYQAGSALKMVAISGGNFKTNNNTLSAITIQNSGDTTNITDGISIKDKTGNNLLYRGVNLTGTATWTGDNITGYTLTLPVGGSYKLMDAIKITDDGLLITATATAVTFDGNDKLITSESATKAPVLISTGPAVTLKNLNLTATSLKNQSLIQAVTVSGTSITSPQNFIVENSKLTVVFDSSENAVDNAILGAGANQYYGILTRPSNNFAVTNTEITITGKNSSDHVYPIKFKALNNSELNVTITNNKLSVSNTTLSSSGVYAVTGETQGSAGKLSATISGNTLTAKTNGTAKLLYYTPVVNNSKFDITKNTVTLSGKQNYVMDIMLSSASSGDHEVNFTMSENTVTVDSSAPQNKTFYVVKFAQRALVDGKSRTAYLKGTIASSNTFTGNDGYLFINQDNLVNSNTYINVDTSKLNIEGQTIDLKIVAPYGTGIDLGNTTQINGTAKKFTVTPAGTPVSWSSDNTTVLTIQADGNYTAHETGTTTITAIGPNNVKATMILTVYKTAKPKIDTKIEQKGDNITISSATGGSATIAMQGDSAIINDPTSGTTLVLTYDGTPDVASDSSSGTVTSVEGKVASVAASYPNTDAPSSKEVDVKVTYELELNLNPNTALTGAIILPTINPAFNEEIADKVKNTNSAYLPIAMITAEPSGSSTLEEINNNITNNGPNGGIKLTFTVPRSLIDAKGGTGKVYVLHIENGVVKETLRVSSTLDGNNYVFVAYGTKFSSYVNVIDTHSSQGGGGGSSIASSSSDGNMENAFRVLFDSKGGSFVQPATGLSYGDRIAQPASPTKDGYTFAGWYKDEAGTIAWIFAEDAIPGDTTLYAKWISQGSGTTNAVATQAASAQSTQSSSVMQTASATQEATPSATTAPAGISPTMTQAPAPLFGMLAGLVAAGVLLRRRE
ncbi:hypothetical protein McpSp1_14350 [Methanocorpusculaceae archaeon Sp1]|nr:hypothetical protein [Methanocorpusculaceae archaeon Sp1]